MLTQHHLLNKKDFETGLIIMMQALFENIFYVHKIFSRTWKSTNWCSSKDIMPRMAAQAWNTVETCSNHCPDQHPWHLSILMVIGIDSQDFWKYFFKTNFLFFSISLTISTDNTRENSLFMANGNAVWALPW